MSKRIQTGKVYQFADGTAAEVTRVSGRRKIVSWRPFGSYQTFQWSLKGFRKLALGSENL